VNLNDEPKPDGRTEPVELQHIVQQAVDAVRSTCTANHQTLKVTVPDSPILLEADTARLGQVLQNFLGNACSFSGEGSHITLSAEVCPAAQPRQVVIRVADHGNGSAADPGLADRLAKPQGGHIEARGGRPGERTELVVRLPVLTHGPTGPAAGNRSPATSLKILIVDDNCDSAECMAMLQEMDGHRTRIALNGHDAVSVAAEFQPQVVLLDLGLPGLNGFEVARRLRQMAELQAVFLVALTGYGSDEDREQTKAAGFDEHLAKPADLNLLRKWLAERV
jgi:CheY-like chemotaxis protein